MVAARHSQFWILKLQSCPLCIFAVYADGSICLDILQNQWSPIYDVAAILTSIQVRINLILTDFSFPLLF